MKEIVVHSYEELSEVVFTDCYEKDIRRYRNNVVYRGVSNKDFRLMPKFLRICGHDLTLENSVIRSFRKYGYADLQNSSSFWQIIATGQHFGLPTRLLDWSYSPLVAAHFATEDIYEYDKDGAIFAIDLEEAHKTLPEVLKKELDDNRASSFTLSMLEKHANSFEELKALSDKPFFLFYEPAASNDRIANQYALFSVCSDASLLINDLVDPEESTLKKIVIPKEVKWEIRDKLDYINISERLLYPGLDGICSWITRHYADLSIVNKKEE